MRRAVGGLVVVVSLCGLIGAAWNAHVGRDHGGWQPFAVVLAGAGIIAAIRPTSAAVAALALDPWRALSVAAKRASDAALAVAVWSECRRVARAAYRETVRDDEVRRAAFERVQRQEFWG